MRQRLLHDEDRYADVLDARLQRDGDDPRPGLAEDGRESGAEDEPDVGQAASGQHVDDGEHPENVGVDVEGDGEEDADDAEEERSQQLEDDGGGAGLEAADEDAKDQRNDDDEEAEGDALEGDDDAGVFIEQILADGEQPQGHHTCSGGGHSLQHICNKSDNS